MRLRRYEITASSVNAGGGGTWTVHLNRAALGRELHRLSGGPMIASLIEAGVDPDAIKEAEAIIAEPYEMMLARRAVSTMAKYRRNPASADLSQLADVFMALADAEVQIPTGLAHAVADILRSIRTAKTKGEAEAVARKLRMHKNVAHDLDRESAASAYRAIRGAGAKDAVARLLVSQLMRSAGSDMNEDGVRNAVRAVAKRQW